MEMTAFEVKVQEQSEFLIYPPFPSEIIPVNTFELGVQPQLPEQSTLPVTIHDGKLILHTLGMLITLDQPVLHKHASIPPDPTIECEFAGHGRHSVLSAAGYEPAEQGTQRTAGVLEYSPGPQKAQSPEEEFEFAHGRHADLPLATYEATAQSEHD